MNQLFTSYLSLGSNLNNKLENLQETVNQIDLSIGKVTNISKTYSTPAWGFSGNDFYNICIQIRTKLSSDNLLEKILLLEKQLGRKIKTTEGYQNRPIDIDIILFEKELITTENLIIPHPRALQRKFVLVPLLDIYHENYNPFNKVSLAENIKNCNDISEITETKNHIRIP